MVVMLSSDANIKAAARTGRTTVVLRDQVRLRFVLHHKLSGVGIRVGWLLVQRLIAQGELRPIIGGLEPRILQGALKTGGVPSQQVERLDALDGQTGRYVAVAIDIQPDLDAPSSGGSRRISNRFLPARALLAISIASPASGIAAGCGSGCETSVAALAALDAVSVCVQAMRGVELSASPR
jgi:hypothetical protein